MSYPRIIYLNAGTTNSSLNNAIGNGWTLSVIVYITANVSGAHINPAVSFYTHHFWLLHSLPQLMRRNWQSTAFPLSRHKISALLHPDKQRILFKPFLERADSVLSAAGNSSNNSHRSHLYPQGHSLHDLPGCGRHFGESAAGRAFSYLCKFAITDILYNLHISTILKTFSLTPFPVEDYTMPS